MADKQSCEHLNFNAQVNVTRMTKDDGCAAVIGYQADVEICCVDCGTKFAFLGLEPGIDTQGARVSVDGLQARIAIAPDGSQPNPLDRIAFNIRAALGKPLDS